MRLSRDVRVALLHDRTDWGWRHEVRLLIVDLIDRAELLMIDLLMILVEFDGVLS